MLLKRRTEPRISLTWSMCSWPSRASAVASPPAGPRRSLSPPGASTSDSSTGLSHGSSRESSRTPEAKSPPGFQVVGGIATTVRSSPVCSALIIAVSAMKRCRARAASPGERLGSPSASVIPGSATIPVASSSPSTGSGAAAAGVCSTQGWAGIAVSDTRKDSAPWAV